MGYSEIRRQPDRVSIVCHRTRQECGGIGQPAREAADLPGRWLCACGKHALTYETADGRTLVAAHVVEGKGY